jgi:anti-anti-sigma factor
MAYIDMRSGVVRAVGDLDIESADAFITLGRTAVQQCSDAKIIVDLSGCTFLDSSGLGALVSVRNAACADGITMYLRGVPERVKRVLEMTGLLDYFPEPDPSTTV